MDIIAGVLFAHMGKHTPHLLVGKDRTPEVVERYIKSIKPMIPKDMPKPPFMHGYILGSTQNISYKEQVIIETMLSIDHEMMNIGHEMTDMHHEMMGMKDGMHCPACMHMHNMNHEGMMNVEHEMTGMHDEMMGMGEEKDMEYTDEMYMHEEDDKNYGKKPCNCKNKIYMEHRDEFSNTHYRAICIDELLG